MSTINNGVLDGVRRVEPGVRGIGVNASLAGAPLGMRLRGATQAGAPAVGSWKAGDQVSDRNGAIWVCTVSGSPGTWAGGAAVKVADTGNSGTALINGTQTILSWTAPADGNLHFLSWAALLHVTSTETGGNVVTTVSGLYTVGNGFSGGATAAWYSASYNAVVPSGDVFQINQSVALTGGAGIVYAQIWGA